MTKLYQAIRGEMPQIPPIWLMRQAGRYLPEYRNIRKNVKNFLQLCYTPELACEVTLQPVARFDVDAAILFSDILVIPDALGMQVDFLENEGPRLNTSQLMQIINAGFNHEEFHAKLAPVYQAIKLIRANLAQDKDLIGFAGGAFTLACYMIEGHTSRDFMKARVFALQYPEKFQQLLNLLTQAISAFLNKQADSGINIAQVFDSWAGLCPFDSIEQHIFKPHWQIKQAMNPSVPIIFFAKGLSNGLGAYSNFLQPEALGVDQFISMSSVINLIEPQNICLQGNLDPMILKVGGDYLLSSLDKLRIATQNRRFIMNLGHGIDKDTPIAHVEALIKRVRAC